VCIGYKTCLFVILASYRIGKLQYAVYNNAAFEANSLFLTAIWCMVCRFTSTASSF